MASNKEEDSNSDNENLCVVCFKNVEIYSIGICDHEVCFECSTRMRVLCCQNECPICRGAMPKVIFTKEVAPFTTLLSKYQYTDLQDRRYGVIFASKEIQKAYQQLLEHRCTICKEPKKFPHFQQLKDHMRREHSLSYCDLCVQNLKIFSFERRAYTRQELGYHRRKGDPDNTSHRGHPLCQFCDTRFMDNDELFRHLRRNHLYCHFCDTDGKHQYYNTMEDLKKHFHDEHYLCEEGECKSMPLIAVFRTEIDLKAHLATAHSKNLSKSATKQARTLEVEFTLAPRPRTDRNKRSSRIERSDEEGAVGYSLETDGIVTTAPTNSFNPLTSQDFPALGGSTVTVQSRPTTTVNFTTSSSRVNPFSGEDFPSLGPSRSSAVTITSNSPASNRKKAGPEITITRTIKGQQKLERNNENFPTLGGGGGGGGGSTSHSIPSATSGTSTVRFSVSNTTPKVSIHVNHNGAITTHVTNAATTSSNNDAFPALNSKITVPVQQPLWVPQKPKTKPEPRSKVTPAPQLPPSDLSQFPTLKTNKRSSSVTVPVTNNWTNNDNTSNTTTSGGGTTTNRNELSINKDDSKSKKKKKKINNNNNNSNNSINNNSALENKNNLTNNRENGIVKKRSELKIGNLSLCETSPSPPQTSNNSTNNSNDSNKPPPGFPSKPPPGLNLNNFPTLGGGNNDLTFTNSSGQSYSIKPTTTIINNYYQPNNFSKRNQDLIKNLMSFINKESIKEFKIYSDLYRNDKITAENYIGHCMGVMGDQFEIYFPELLILLPDIDKQQQLYNVYNGKNKSKLLICEKCKQIIYKNELNEHYHYHTLDNNFPTLGGGGGGGNKSDGGFSNAWKK